jgi:hypothetical protein
VAAGAGEGRGLGQRVLRDGAGIGQHRPALGERAGLVEHDRVDPGQAFQRGRRLEQHAPAHEAAAGDDLHRRHGEAQRAGAAARKAAATKGPERLREAGLRSAATKGTEAMREAARQAAAKRSPEERRETARKGRRQRSPGAAPRGRAEGGGDPQAQQGGRADEGGAAGS